MLRSGALVLLLCLAAVPAQAQFDDTLWGISGTVNPGWKSPSYVGVVFGAKDNDANYFALEGSELSIGFVRGKNLGGEWGISFVRSTFKDGSFVVRDDGSRVTTKKNSILGGMIHRFVPFGTIKERVQIGMNIGIGAGQIRGEMVKAGPGQTQTVIKGKEFLTIDDTNIPVSPLAKLELSIGAILTPGLKIRANGGLNFPGYQKFSVTATYLFGAR
jgi:hypothetical protein